MTCDQEAVTGLSTALDSLLEEFRDDIKRLLSAKPGLLASVNKAGFTFTLSAFSCDALEGLTRRELEIAQAVAHGLPDKGIAQTLGISTRTVSCHLRRIYRKTGVHSRMELAQLVSLFT